MLLAITMNDLLVSTRDISALCPDTAPGPLAYISVVYGWPSPALVKWPLPSSDLPMYA